MDNNFMKMKAAVVVAAFALPSITFADGLCLTAFEATDENDSGRGTLVQGDQGQGSIDCSVFQGYDSGMQDISQYIELEGGVSNLGVIGTVTEPLFWKVSDLAPADIHVDVLFISNAGDGSRCSQFYVNNAHSGYAGAGLKINKDSTVVACADSHFDPQPIPAPTPPLATNGDNDCGVGDTKVFQDAIDASNGYHGLILFGPGVAEGSSGLCTKTNLKDDPEKGKLKQCVNRCINPAANPDLQRNTPVFDDPSANSVCTGDGPFYPIECRVCELHTDVEDPQNPGVEYCWEQIQKANLEDTANPQLPDYSNGTFKKAPGSKGEQVWGIDRKHGSDCYLINGKTASGWPYSYWFPSGCPD